MKLYVVLLDTLTGGHVAAQCAHAVAEIHAREPGACAAWSERGVYPVVRIGAESMVASSVKDESVGGFTSTHSRFL